MLKFSIQIFTFKSYAYTKERKDTYETQNTHFGHNVCTLVLAEVTKATLGAMFKMRMV